MDVLELQSVAVVAAQEAAALIRSQRTAMGDVRMGMRLKSSEVDPVTVVDEAAEAYLAQRLRELRPDDGFFGEEGHHQPTRSGVLWSIDPIDGTVNFLYGQPNYGVSLAATMEGITVAGAVVQVPTDTVFAAALDQGAWCEQAGKRHKLHVSQESHLSQTLVATGFSYDAQRRAEQAALLTHILPHVRDIRRLGSAALDLCMLAAGQVDAYYEHGLNHWDYAAGALIAQEAGALVTQPPITATAGDGVLIRAAAPGVAQAFFDLVGQGALPLSK